jgi:hypothetical protein
MNPTALSGPNSPATAHPARWRVLSLFRRRHLTLFGRSVVLVGCELLANAICWIVAGILFRGKKDTQPILSLALLAWVCAALLVSESTRNKFWGFPRETIGLRHGELIK